MQKDRLSALQEHEKRIQAAWIGRGATPFPGQIDPHDAESIVQDVRDAVSGSLRRLRSLFECTPCLAVWATLRPLALHYASVSRDVYAPIEDALGVRLQSADDRNTLKVAYRSAATKMGVAVTGNDPNTLFFGPLGVAEAQLAPIARSMVSAMRRFGPPATEDTPSAVNWQRRALQIGISSGWLTNLPRPCAAMRFDGFGYYATLANRWRTGTPPATDREQAVHEALACAARRMGVTRERIVPPPRAHWAASRLSVMPEHSTLPQDLYETAIPVRLQAGVPHALNSPWPSHVRWKADRVEEVPCAPSAGELLIFDGETGTLLHRAALVHGDVPIASRHVVLLAAQNFEVEGFGPSVPAHDPAFHWGWVDLEGTKTAEFSGKTVRLLPDASPGLRLDAAVLGRAGSRPLYEGYGAVHVQVNPLLPGPRLLRVSRETGTRHAPVLPNAVGSATVPFETLGLAGTSDPTRAVFDLLPLGAGELAEARAELTTTAFVWPGVRRAKGRDIEHISEPTNWNEARSAGFVRGPEGGLSMDPAADVEAARLAVRIDGKPIDLVVPFRGVRLWRIRTNTGQRERVPHGALLVFGHAARHDTLSLQAENCQADLRVLGRQFRRPLLGHTHYSIGAGLLEGNGDDRIALTHPDGSLEVLARFQRVNDPHSVELIDGEGEHGLRFHPPAGVDAVGVRVRGIDGSISEGAAPLHFRPVPNPLPDGLEIATLDDGHVELRVAWQAGAPPARIDLIARLDNAEAFETVRTAFGHPVSLGAVSRNHVFQQEHLGTLAKLLAAPVAPETAEQLQATLGAALKSTMEAAGETGQVFRVMPALEADPDGGCVARGDFLSGAPWIFEVRPSNFARLEGNRHLSALASVANIPPPTVPPNPHGPDPLGAWIGTLASGDDVPTSLSAQALQSAFVALRTRLTASGAEDLRSGSPVASALRAIVDVDNPHRDALRGYDRTMGHDAFGADIAAALERLARASACGIARSHFDEVVRRTGLSSLATGQALSVAVRLGVEVFVYFLALWRHGAAAANISNEEQQELQA